MKILYVFPHPDDESFGPAPAMARQVREGHEVHLLTLTRGGATKERHRLGLSVEEMGEVRLNEMRCVERTLGLAGMTVLDFTDSGLKEEDPINLEDAVRREVTRVHPHVLVTYAVHGISGFHDHLVTHAVVKRLWSALRREGASAPQRLAFFTFPESADLESGPHRLQASRDEEIDCRIPLEDRDLEAGRKALDCYRTYAEMIRQARPLERMGSEVCFEFFRETFAPPLTDFTADLGEGDGRS